MRKKFLSIILLSGLAAGALYASNDKEESRVDLKKENCSMGEKMIGMKKESSYKGHGIMGAIHDLDLSDNQKTQIKELMQKNRPQKQNLSKFFEGGKFDKEAYVQMQLDRKKNMIEYKAQMIEDIYKILTKEQQKEFLEKIEKYGSNENKGLKNHDKYCDGRR